MVGTGASRRGRPGGRLTTSSATTFPSSRWYRGRRSSANWSQAFWASSRQAKRSLPSWATAVAESVRLPVEDQNVCPVRNPVQQGRGQGCVAEHLLPAGKLQVAGDDQAPRLVPLRHELEEQRCPGS